MQVSDTGNAKVDAMGDVINNALAPFFEAPDPEKGVLGVVEQGIGAVMGLQNAPLELLNTGFAMLTAPIAALMPAFPAAYLTVLHVGMPHTHVHPPSLIPPAPPVPLPSIGNLMLPGCVSVLIGGMPAGRAGDLGLAMTCGSFAPAFDVFLGSSNTFIGGNRAARMTDMTRHCNPASKTLLVSRGAAKMAAAIGAVGVGASLAAGQAMQAAIAAAQIAADAAAAALSALLGTDPGVPPAMGALMLGNPTVLIGGFPCPNFPNPLDGIMAGLKKLGKAIAQSKGIGKLLKKVGLCNQPGEPVNAFTGEVYNDFEDYRATDSGFTWERHYRSGWNQQDGPLGFGHRHFFQRTLTLLRKRAIYETHDNEVVALAALEDGSYAPTDGFRLTTADRRRYQLTTDRDETLEFDALPTTPPTARLSRYKSAKVDVYLHYDAAGRLQALTEYLTSSMVDTHFVYDAQGRIEQLARGRRGQQPLTIARYGYRDGCLVEWRDPLGAPTRFLYDAARRMLQGTDRRGYSFHWRYDPASGRCVRSWGDDGLWGVEAKYEGSQSFFTEPDGGIWAFKHYPDGTLSHVIDPLGGVTQYIQEQGRVVRQITPSGLVYTWLYDVNGRHTGRRGPYGELLPPEDALPDPPNPLRHRGPTTQQGWLWGAGHAASVAPLSKLPRSVLAQLIPVQPTEPAHILDPAGRIVRTEFPDGKVEQFQHDLQGNWVARADTRGNVWQRHIVSWNLVGAEKSPLGAITQYEYTHRQKRLAVTDAHGNRSEYRRDRAQRVIEVIRNGKPYLRYIRSPMGVVLEERDGEGELLVQHQATATGLHVASRLSTGESYKYAYDALGNFIDASSGLHRVERRFDRRKQTADLRDERGIEHSFDGDGVATSVFLGRFRTQYRNLRSGVEVITPDARKHRFWRDEAFLLCRENANGTSESMAFDDDGRVVARARWRSAPGADAPQTWMETYRYDPEGLLEQVLDSERGPIRFDYDGDHRLLTQHGPGSVRFDYRYDLAGNLVYTPTHGRISAQPQNFLAFSQVEQFEYDSRHRLSKRVRFGGVETNYAYDSNDQLVEVRFSDRSEVWRAAYDGLGRRLWREYGGKRTDFYWDGDRLAGEIAPDGLVRVYVYANEGTLVPFMWLEYTGLEADPATAKARYLFCTPTGMPVRIEDEHGEVVWESAAHEPYGHIHESNVEAPPTRLRFAGHFYDDALGLFYNRFRDYDPTLCRYLQPDPLGHAGGLNLYAYPANPAADVDLRGLIHKGKTPPSDPGGEQGGDKKPPQDSEPAKYKSHADGEPINPKTGLTKSQEADFRRRIDAAEARGDKKAADDVRHERNSQKRANRDPAQDPMPRQDWDESNERIRNNSERGRVHEDNALDDLGVQNNNRDTDADGKPRDITTYDNEGGEGKTRPDGVTDSSVVDVKSVPPGRDADGNPRTVYQTEQLRSQKAGAGDEGKQHVTVISSDGPADDTRPSRNLGDSENGGSDAVLHRDNTAEPGREWSQWDPEANNGEGGWQPISSQDARSVVGSWSMRR
ncbi:MAG: DUF6531 domain-containing protein [Myxococcota bacterium]|nr:DUF6531 domain-containing protein [Myxococcota bacterium]